MGLTEAEVRDAEYDLDDGVYELEFKANGMEYEYAVNAVTGEIVKAEKSRDD